MACPPPPQTERREDLGFERKGVVPWFHPKELLDTGLLAAVSSVFGTYSDRREMEAALNEPEQYDELAGEGELWIDFAADLGDGWNATYAIARLLAEEKRAFSSAGSPAGRSYPTQRGRLLVLGGDQVYPAATARNYEDRFVGPYTAALPCVLQGEAPLLFAIPGNHDWYDGLTSFLRLFCQSSSALNRTRWIGGWRTRQSRSYFAIRLPHDWWIWGVDIQLHADIDGPQIEYFQAVATGSLGGRPPTDRFLDGHKIILCTGQPSWVYPTRKGREAYHNLDFFEQKVIQKHGGKLVLTLTGDLHHYARYQSAGGDGETRTHKITAGGGGAYLYGTHDLPDEVTLGRDKTRYERAGRSFPDVAISRKLARGAWRFPFLRVNWGFTLFLGLLYLLYAWVLQSDSKQLGGDLMLAIRELRVGPAGIAEGIQSWLGVLKHSPGSAILTGVVVVGLVLFADASSRWRWIVGAVHGVAHVALSLALFWALAIVNLGLLGLDSESLWQILLFSVLMLVFGGIAGGLLMGFYLVLTNELLHIHTNEVFVSQAIQDFKCFLRMHLDKNGKLTVYPIGVTRVPRSWRLNREARDGQPWFEPMDGPIVAHLIEEPIEIRR